MEKKYKELKKLYGKPLDEYKCFDFIEATWKYCGDILTFRITKEGRVYER